MSCILSSAACFFSHSFGVATFRRRPSIAEISTWHQHNCSMAAYKGGICGILEFCSCLPVRFSLHSQGCQGGARQPLQTIEKQLPFAVLPRALLVDRPRCGAEPNIHRLALRFVRPFPIGAMAFGGVLVAGTPRLAAFHSGPPAASVRKFTLRAAVCGLLEQKTHRKLLEQSRIRKPYV